MREEDAGRGGQLYPLWRWSAAIAAGVVAVSFLDFEELWLNECQVSPGFILVKQAIDA